MNDWIIFDGNVMQLFGWISSNSWWLDCIEIDSSLTHNDVINWMDIVNSTWIKSGLIIISVKWLINQ